MYKIDSIGDNFGSASLQLVLLQISNKRGNEGWDLKNRNKEGKAKGRARVAVLVTKP